jgi:hypothetical protein
VKNVAYAVVYLDKSSWKNIEIEFYDPGWLAGNVWEETEEKI